MESDSSSSESESDSDLILIPSTKKQRYMALDTLHLEMMNNSETFKKFNTASDRIKQGELDRIGLLSKIKDQRLSLILEIGADAPLIDTILISDMSGLVRNFYFWSEVNMSERNVGDGVNGELVSTAAGFEGFGGFELFKGFERFEGGVSAIKSDIANSEFKSEQADSRKSDFENDGINSFEGFDDGRSGESDFKRGESGDKDGHNGSLESDAVSGLKSFMKTDAKSDFNGVQCDIKRDFDSVINSDVTSDLKIEANDDSKGDFASLNIERDIKPVFESQENHNFGMNDTKSDKRDIIDNSGYIKCDVNNNGQSNIKTAIESDAKSDFPGKSTFSVSQCGDIDLSGKSAINSSQFGVIDFSGQRTKSTFHGKIDAVNRATKGRQMSIFKNSGSGDNTDNKNKSVYCVPSQFSESARGSNSYVSNESSDFKQSCIKDYEANSHLNNLIGSNLNINEKFPKLGSGNVIMNFASFEPSSSADTYTFYSAYSDLKDYTSNVSGDFRNNTFESNNRVKHLINEGKVSDKQSTEENKQSFDCNGLSAIRHPNTGGHQISGHNAFINDELFQGFSDFGGDNDDGFITADDGKNDTIPSSPVKVLNTASNLKSNYDISLNLDNINVPAGLRTEDIKIYESEKSGRSKSLEKRIIDSSKPALIDLDEIIELILDSENSDVGEIILDSEDSVLSNTEILGINDSRLGSCNRVSSQASNRDYLQTKDLKNCSDKRSFENTLRNDVYAHESICGTPGFKQNSLASIDLNKQYIKNSGAIKLASPIPVRAGLNFPNSMISGTNGFGSLSGLGGFKQTEHVVQSNPTRSPSSAILTSRSKGSLKSTLANNSGESDDESQVTTSNSLDSTLSELDTTGDRIETLNGINTPVSESNAISSFSDCKKFQTTSIKADQHEPMNIHRTFPATHKLAYSKSIKNPDADTRYDYSLYRGLSPQDSESENNAAPRSKFTTLKYKKITPHSLKTESVFENDAANNNKSEELFDKNFDTRSYLPMNNIQLQLFPSSLLKLKDITHIVSRCLLINNLRFLEQFDKQLTTQKFENVTPIDLDTCIMKLGGGAANLNDEPMVLKLYQKCPNVKLTLLKLTILLKSIFIAGQNEEREEKILRLFLYTLCDFNMNKFGYTELIEFIQSIWPLICDSKAFWPILFDLQTVDYDGENLHANLHYQYHVVKLIHLACPLLAETLVSQYLFGTTIHDVQDLYDLLDRVVFTEPVDENKIYRDHYKIMALHFVIKPFLNHINQNDLEPNYSKVVMEQNFNRIVNLKTRINRLKNKYEVGFSRTINMELDKKTVNLISGSYEQLSNLVHKLEADLFLLSENTGMDVLF